LKLRTIKNIKRTATIPLRYIGSKTQEKPTNINPNASKNPMKNRPNKIKLKRS